MFAELLSQGPNFGISMLAADRPVPIAVATINLPGYWYNKLPSRAAATNPPPWLN